MFEVELIFDVGGCVTIESRGVTLKKRSLSRRAGIELNAIRLTLKLYWNAVKGSNINLFEQCCSILARSKHPWYVQVCVSALFNHHVLLARQTRIKESENINDGDTSNP